MGAPEDLRELPPLPGFCVCGRRLPLGPWARPACPRCAAQASLGGLDAASRLLPPCAHGIQTPAIAGVSWCPRCAGGRRPGTGAEASGKAPTPAPPPWRSLPLRGLTPEAAWPPDDDDDLAAAVLGWIAVVVVCALAGVLLYGVLGGWRW